MNILLVDDNNDYLEGSAEVLNMEGHKVDIAVNITEVKNKINSTTYDFALIDMLLGKDSGIDALKIVKDSSPSTNVIMITGHSDDNLLSEAMHKGALKIYKKPIKWENLLELLS